MSNYYPADTQQIVDRSQISNFALRYRHFLKNEPDDDGKVKFSISATSLGDSQQMLEHLRNRQTEQVRHLWKNGNHFFCGVSKVDWRMVVGMGTDHVQETSMTLHHVYGVPIIPGSAIKGVVRSWVIDKFDGKEDLALADSDFLAVFGSQEQEGKVQFLDAYPNENSVSFAVDIMNPHFPKYYAGTSRPTDDQNPVPINFLTIEQTEFRFLLVAKEQALVELAKGWLSDAITNKGLGAKTAVGYGYFRSLGDRTKNLSKNFANYQKTPRKRTPKPKKYSLDDAIKHYQKQPSLDIDIEPIKDCATKFAIIATREICEIEAIGGIGGIPATLIETDDDCIMISEFGAWVWKRIKDDLLTARILNLPRLNYSTAFRKDLKRLSADERVSIQEQLIEISNQLEDNDGDTEKVPVEEQINYTVDKDKGTLTLLSYKKQYF